MKQLQEYKILIYPDDNETFVASIPAIPTCHAWGRTPNEAYTELGYVFEMIRDEYIEEGRSLPMDTESLICNES